MRLYFARSELALDESADGEYVLRMGADLLGRFRNEKRAVAAYNRVRRELEEKLPPTGVTAEEQRALLEKYLADALVQHNSLRDGPAKRPPKSRTFG